MREGNVISIPRCNKEGDSGCSMVHSKRMPPLPAFLCIFCRERGGGTNPHRGTEGESIPLQGLILMTSAQSDKDYLIETIVLELAGITYCMSDEEERKSNILRTFCAVLLWLSSLLSPWVGVMSRGDGIHILSLECRLLLAVGEQQSGLHSSSLGRIGGGEGKGKRGLPLSRPC